MSRRSSRRWVRRLMLIGLFTAGAAVTAVAAWAYRSIPLRTVEVSGTARADAEQVIRLAALPDSIALADVEPRLVADRVRRHPWVREARVRRLPTGTLQIRIEERLPAALVLDAGGRPTHFLDAEGHALPLADSPPFDVPVLRGSVPDAPETRAVADPTLIELLQALSQAPPEEDALVSEVIYTPGDATVRTLPVTGHPALTVRLGAGGYADKLHRLRAFFDQAVLTRPGHPIQTIDLRFDGQVVTREAAPQRRPAGDDAESFPIPPQP